MQVQPSQEQTEHNSQCSSRSLCPSADHLIPQIILNSCSCRTLEAWISTRTSAKLQPATHNVSNISLSHKTSTKEASHKQILNSRNYLIGSLFDTLLSDWSTSFGTPSEPVPGKQSFCDQPGLQADRSVTEESTVNPLQMASYLALGACPNADQWKLPSKGRMPTTAGRNADWVQCRIFPLCESTGISILSSTYFLVSAYSVQIV